MAAGGCIGSLAIIVPDTELEYIVNDHLTGRTAIIVAWVNFKIIIGWIVLNLVEGSHGPH